MNPKLHKSKELSEIIEIKNSEYINITENSQTEGRPIVAGQFIHKQNFYNATFNP